MKKLLSLILCLTIAVLALVGCAEEPIGDYEYDYVPESVEELSLNLYIVGGNESHEHAEETVRQRIAQYTKQKYHTTVNVIFVSEDEYAATVTAKTAIGAANKADIVLINSKSMMDQLYTGGYLENLTEFFGSQKYGKINVQIAKDILAAAVIQETSNIDGVDTVINSYYAVPNNYVVGEYEYLLIDKATAKEYYIGLEEIATYESLEYVKETNLWIMLDANGLNPQDYIKVETLSENEIEALEETHFVNTLKEVAPPEGDPDPAPQTEGDDNGETPNTPKYYEVVTVDKAVAEQYGYDAEEISSYTDIEALKAGRVTLWHKLLKTGKDPAQYIRLDYGMYEDKVAFEAAGNYCNVLSYPTATAEDVYKSAFAVVKGTKNPERAMEIIYAINTDTELRNLLQYGVKDTHFTLEEINVGTDEKPIKVNVVTMKNALEDGEKSVYRMNLLYTGDIFNAYYCDAYDWTYEAASNGRIQNFQSNEK